MRPENDKYSEVVNISGGEHCGGWNVRGVKRPGGETSGGETSGGETVGGVNHPGGELSVGVKKKLKRGEPSGGEPQKGWNVRDPLKQCQDILMNQESYN